MNILFYLVPKANVTFIYEDNTVEEAMKVMETDRFTSVPVLTREGGYAGSLREGDILWGLYSRPNVSRDMLAHLQVRHLKRLRDNQPVNIGCTMEELIPTAMNQNFIPVVDDNRTFIGIVTRKSVLTFCLQQAQESENRQMAVREQAFIVGPAESAKIEAAKV